MRFPPSFLDEIRQRVSLVDVVGRKVRLQKKGREFGGLCPFHNEKTPSFTVVEEKGFYHCFGCGAHGDVIRFLTENEGVPFPEAVERLAGEAGLQMPEYTPEQAAAEEKRSTLYEVMDAATRWFISQLGGQGADTARAYLDNRGLTSETIRTFAMGFAPDRNDGLKTALLARNFSEEQMIDCGLLIKPDDGRPSFDRFRSRIMFPITDRQDRVIAFGGRAMDKNAKAKYMNSPETPLFHKGHNLYNFSRARRAAFDASQIIVAEGYMDVIALAQAGFEEAVAPLGTAVTEDQLGLLWRITGEPILCFDGDNAGQKAAGRALERALPLLKAGQSLQFAIMPEGEDPDSLVQNEGAEAFQIILDKATSLVDLLWETMTGGVDVSTPERRAGLERKVFTQLSQVKDDQVKVFYQKEYRSRLNDLFGVKKSTQRTKFKKNAGPFGRGFNQRRTSQSRYGIDKTVGLIPDSTPGFAKTRVGRAQGNEVVTNYLEDLLMLIIINHPAILTLNIDDFESIGFLQEDLSRVRDSLINAINLDLKLDIEAIRNHLLEKGFESVYTRLIDSDRLKIEWFAWGKAALEDAESGWFNVLDKQRTILGLQKDIKTVEEEARKNKSHGGFERLKALKEELEKVVKENSEISGFGMASGRDTTI
jgi:DNA primase